MSYFTLPAGASVRPEIEGLTTAAGVRQIAPSAIFAPGMRCSTSIGLFLWDATSLVADDGATVLRPNDVGVGDPGRWILFPKRARFENNVAPQNDAGVDVPVLADWPDAPVNPFTSLGITRVSPGGYSFGSGTRGLWMVAVALGLVWSAGVTDVDLLLQINGTSYAARTLPLPRSTSVQMDVVLPFDTGDLVNVFWTPRGAGGTQMNANNLMSWIEFVQVSR